MRILPFAVLIACGGESGPIIGQPDAADAASATDSSGDAPSASDVTGDVAPPDAGISNPGKISCGTVECSSPAQVCCGTFALPKDGGSSTSLACTEPTKCAGTAGACDEQADCPTPQVCCLGVGSTWSPITLCKTSCQLTDTQLCKTDAECASKKCSLYTCAAGFTVHACIQPTC